MRRNTLQTTLVALAMTTLAGLPGCETANDLVRSPSIYEDPKPTPPDQQDDPRLAMNPGQRESNPKLQRLFDRLDALEYDNQQLKKQLSDQYMRQVAQRAEAQTQASQRPSSSQAQPVQPEPVAPAPSPSVRGASTPVSTDSLTRDDLVDLLLERIAESRDPAHVKALSAAVVSLASPSHGIDHHTLDALDPRTRERVARFHQMLAMTYDQLAANPDKPISQSEMIDKINRVFGERALTIDALELCRRVDSFGVYEPFPSRRFLAGQANRALVYVELDHFKHQPTDDGEYEVRLEQQVELFDSTGETTVWRQGPIELVDLSRNQRRDFFVVYPIDLPARLPVGTYRLKVRIADKHTGSLCEQTLHDIEIVADPSLVNLGR